MTGIPASAPAPAIARSRNHEILRRISYRFSPDGAFAACLAVRANGRIEAETWSLRGAEPVSLVLPGSVEETVRTQVVPTPDGRILALRLGTAEHHVVLLEPGAPTSGEPRTLERPVATLTTRGARLMPCPEPGLLGLLITTGETTEIWHVLDGPEPRLDHVLTSGDLLGGGVWPADDGSLLSLQRMTAAGADPVIADLRIGTITPDPAALPSSLVIAAHPPTGLRLLLIDDPQLPFRLGRPGNAPVTPTALSAIATAGSFRSVEFAPDGEHLAIHTTDGARSRLHEYDLATDTIREVEIPPGVITGPLHWSPDSLRFLFAAPEHPTGLATLHADGSWSLTGARRRPRTAHLENVPGPAGPIPTVVYGGPDWWRAPDLVLALHGGPAENWSLDYDPFFSALDAAGIAVLAVNQRGSTGYGHAHQDALRGAWGVPDLEDILAIGTDLASRRGALGLRPPVLYGVSYGAFLALLAIRVRPDLWRRCAVGAPFLSAPRLRRDAEPRVRAMLDSLGACPAARDAHGPRDLAELYGPGAEIDQRPAIYLVHGRQDTTIPVEHSRELVGLLAAAGWHDGSDLHYRELPDVGHGIFESDDGDELAASLVRFTLHGSPQPTPAAEPAHEPRGSLAAV